MLQPVNDPAAPAGIDMFGESIAVGDFNGDGLDDVAIGAPFADSSAGANVGAVRIWFGELGFSTPCPGTGCASPFVLDGGSKPADLVLFGQTANSQMATTLAAVGDINGGGADELLVGGVNSAIVVDLDLAVGITTLDPWLTLVPSAATSRFGGLVGSLRVNNQTVLWSGDIGTAALLPRVYFYRDTGAGWDGDPDLDLVWYGTSVIAQLSAAAAISDWYQDPFGTSDFILGCSQCVSSTGNVKVWRGEDLFGTVDLDGALGLGYGGPIETHIGPANSRTGAAFAGFADGTVGVGATHYSASNGRVWIVNHTAAPIATRAQLVGTFIGKLGSSVAALDIDHDGQQDVVGGAPSAALSGDVRGMVKFGAGHAAGASPPAVDSPMFMWGPTHTSTAVGSQFGKVLAVGDINGDTFQDVFIGAPKAKYLNNVPLNQEFGAVFLLYGGRPLLPDEMPRTAEWYSPDLDQDGFGDAEADPIQRCTIPPGFAANGDDCDDGDATITPTIQECGTPQHDCFETNDELCSPRLGTDTQGGAIDLHAATLCFGAGVWPIGPAVGDATQVTDDEVTVEHLARMVDEGTLFFNALDDGYATAVVPLSACPVGISPTIILDVIGNYPDPEQTPGAPVPYPEIMTTVVSETLRLHNDAYIVGTLQADTTAPSIVVLGGDYPGLVNGVVDVLRYAEYKGGVWDLRTMMDYPENRRRLSRGWGKITDCAFAPGVAVDPPTSPWLVPPSWIADCAGGVASPTQLAAFDNIDFSLAYHLSVVRPTFDLDGTWTSNHNLDAQAGEATSIVEQIKYLRRRGIDAEPRLSAPPMSQAVPSFEPNPVWDMPYHRVTVTPPAPAAAFDVGMPCADDDCSAPVAVQGSTVSSNKYLMHTDGDDAGLVYARNMVNGVVAPIGGCTAATATAACLSGPCWCGEAATTTGVSTDVTANGSLQVFLADVGRQKPANWTGGREDWLYGLWPSASSTAFRPGRNYAFHFKATWVSGPVPAVITVDTTVGALSAKMNLNATATETAAVSDNMSFVFRAPLQLTDHPNGSDTVPLWGASPSLRLSVGCPAPDPECLAAGGLPVVRITDLAVVELDGLATGHLLQVDADGQVIPGEVAAEVDIGGDFETWTGTPAGCLAGQGCVPYAQEDDCGNAYSGYGVSYHLYERFGDGGPALLTADALRRLVLTAGPEPVARVSGVLRPILGSYRATWFCRERDHEPIEAGGDPAMKVMPQPVDLFSPEVWATDHRFGNTLPEQLRFLAEERTALGQSSVQDYLYGVAWHSEQPVVSMAVFSEQWLFNMGFAGWRQGVYAPLPNHAVYRAMICNIANAVNHPDWTNGGNVGATSSFQKYCDFGASPACGDELDELTGPEPCDLVSTGSSGFHVAIDTNMQRDSAAEHTLMLKGAQSGSLSLSWLTADLYGSPAAPVSSDTTAPATLPSNVDTLMWDFFPDMHETLEGVCDVAETSDFFFGQPSVPAMFGGTGPELEACMMTGRESVATITGMGGASDYAAPVDGNDQVARDSVMHFSSLGSGHPDLFAGVEYSEQLDEYGGSDALDFSSTSGAQAAACMWNPQWRHIATISTTSMRTAPAPWDYDSISPWCPSGSSWVAGRQYVNVEDTVPAVYQYMCADLGLNKPFDPNNCVRAASPGTLTVAMKPDLGSLVEVQPEWVGRTVRAQAVIGNAVGLQPNFMRWYAGDPEGVAPSLAPGPVNSRSCFAAWGWKYGFNAYGYPYSDVVRGTVFFISASGELVTASGVTPGPLSCGATPLDLSGSTFEAEVRPLFINFSELPVAVASVAAEIPPGTVRMGVRFDIAGVALDNSEPVLSDITLQLGLADDPRVRRAVTLDSAGDYAYDPATGGDLIDPITGEAVLAPPRACEDASWFVATAGKTDPVAYPTEVECLMLFGTLP